MSEFFDTDPYSFLGIINMNYRDALRWSSGAEGFSTLILVNPARQDGPPVSSELDSECNEETRLMLQQLYTSLDIDLGSAVAEEGWQDNDPQRSYERRVTYISPTYGVRFIEVSRTRDDSETFQVWAEPQPASTSSPLSSARHN